MHPTNGETLTVGRITIAYATAEQWVRSYTSERNQTAAGPYAYPAYDQYNTEHSAPDRLSDADLLAPVLLNVRLSLRAYYSLQRIRPALEKALAHKDLEIPLRHLDDPERVSAVIGPLYQVLDTTPPPHGVRGTTLSKVLHRKRPPTLVLHDTWVRACYVGDDAPVPRADRRTWAEYMSQISVAIGHDLRTQRDMFIRLREATGAPDQISDVRVLDIIAWTSRGCPPSEAATPPDPDPDGD